MCAKRRNITNPPCKARQKNGCMRKEYRCGREPAQRVDVLLVIQHDENLSDTKKKRQTKDSAGTDLHVCELIVSWEGTSFRRCKHFYHPMRWFCTSSWPHPVAMQSRCCIAHNICRIAVINKITMTEKREYTV